MRGQRFLPLLWMLLGLAVFEVGVTGLEKLPRDGPEEVMRVKLPVFAQLLVAGGDRYLAANMGVFRAVTLGVGRQDPATFATLAGVQEDAAWLNPGNEDNYYTAIAILPWNGQLRAAQHILLRTIDGRPTDVYPPFYYAFHQWYFLHDYSSAARYLTVAANRVDGNTRLVLLNMAGKWSLQAQDPFDAIRILGLLKQQSNNQQLRELFDKRIERIRHLSWLLAKVRAYENEFGRRPADIAVLAQWMKPAMVPAEPMGGQYVLDQNGWPAIQDRM